MWALIQESLRPGPDSRQQTHVASSFEKTLVRPREEACWHQGLSVGRLSPWEFSCNCLDLSLGPIEFIDRDSKKMMSVPVLCGRENVVTKEPPPRV